MEDLKRNALGFELLAIGVFLVLLGSHTHIDRLADAGFSLIGMAGLALSASVPQRPKDPGVPAP